MYALFKGPISQERSDIAKWSNKISLGSPIVNMENILKLFFCSHKTKNSRSLQKTYLELRLAPLNRCSEVFLFITRDNFRSFGPVQDPLLAELPQRQTVFSCGWLQFGEPKLCQNVCLWQTFEVVLALENIPQVTSISPPQYMYVSDCRAVA